MNIQSKVGWYLENQVRSQKDPRDIDFQDFLDDSEEFRGSCLPIEKWAKAARIFDILRVRFAVLNYGFVLNCLCDATIQYDKIIY